MTDEVKAMIDERRKALAESSTGPLWGLALSGGGIRSATFCFGLLHALAQKQMLLRFDLLSTVSGGGYIGSMIGRLFDRAQSPAQVEAMALALGSANTTWFSWWLRANGRYLIPRGVSDTLFALGIYLRNFVGVHVELGIAGLILGSLLALWNWFSWQALDFGLQLDWPNWLEWSRDWLAWLPSLWVLAPLALLGGLVALQAYWSIPIVTRRDARLLGLIAALGAATAFWVGESWLVGPKDSNGYAMRSVMCKLGFIISSCWVLAFAFASFALRRAATRAHTEPMSLFQDGYFASARQAWAQQAAIDTQDAARNLSTTTLAGFLKALLIILLVGALDRAAWWLAFEFVDWLRTGIWLLAAAAVLRALLPLVPKLQAGTAGTEGLLKLGNLLGRLLTLSLFAWWVAVVHKATLGSIFSPDRAPQLSAALTPALVILCAAALYALATGYNVRFLNLSSLHSFYRSRLVRSYLGAVNPDRFFSDEWRPPLGAASSLPNDPHKHHLTKVWEVHRDDDVAITEYAPHVNGGPVHLINVCLNETTDPSGGLFNKDRRGRLITIAPGGLLRVSQQQWRQLDQHSPDSLTLGSWMSISGAALAPGLGNMTRGGISALTMFAGARLGFWWDSSVLEDFEPERRKNPAKLWGVLREMSGWFAGTEERDWFLTDGGHFENTGAYALLAERCRFILLADCGADPSYRFRDLENLVRKARIDLKADVQFLRPIDNELDSTKRLPGLQVEAQGQQKIDSESRKLLAMFGSLNDLASTTSVARFALARIVYSDDGDSGPVESVGNLLLVKPNLCAGLPVDLFNFKAEHPQFPQQGTADQFFDEAQWESYFQLGKSMIEPLQQPILAKLLENERSWFVKDDGSPIEPSSVGTSANTSELTPKASTEGASSANAEGRIPARIAAQAVTAATVGLGAAATAGVTVWQAIDSVRKSVEERTQAERKALQDLSTLWAELQVVSTGAPSTASIAIASKLAAALARVSDTLCPTNEADWFHKSPLAVDILQSARHVCSQLDGQSISCDWLLNASDPFAAGSRASCLATGSALAEQRYASVNCTQYWGWDYRRNALPECAHSKDPIANARRADLVSRREENKVELIAADPTDTELSALQRKGACAGLTIFPMLYGPELKSTVETYLAPWRALGARVGATEDVDARARMYRLAKPLPFTATRIRYHESASRQCALSIRDAARDATANGEAATKNWQIEGATPLSPAKPGAIEVWLRPVPEVRIRSLPELPVQREPSATVEPTPQVKLLEKPSDPSGMQAAASRPEHERAGASAATVTTIITSTTTTSSPASSSYVPIAADRNVSIGATSPCAQIVICNTKCEPSAPKSTQARRPNAAATQASGAPIIKKRPRNCPDENTNITSLQNDK